MTLFIRLAKGRSMPQIQFLTPAQEALIPEYQEKWKHIYLLEFGLIVTKKVVNKSH